MPRIKTILCSGICLLYITALTAQALPPKNKTISNVVGYQVYQQKLWSMKQLPKNSVLYQYNAAHVFKSFLSSAPGSDLPIDIPFTTLLPRNSASPLTFSETMQLGVQTNKNTWDGHAGWWKLSKEKYLESEFLARSRQSLLGSDPFW
jgi:hypothetical protein